MVKLAYKITAMVVAQIILIVTSFLTIVHFEFQAYHTGSMVNVAGKNRVLTILVHNELVDEILQHGQLRDGSRAMSALGDLKNNILFLKEGGTTYGAQSAPLSQRFQVEWDAIWDKFGQYEGMVVGFVSAEVGPGGNGPATAAAQSSGGQIGDIRRTGDELVVLSDMLTDKLGRDVDAHSSNLILLQVVLGTVNVAVHVVMIVLIWRIFNRYAEQRVRMEKFAVLGEFAAMMAHNLKNPLGTILNSATMIKLRGDDASATGPASDRIERAVRRMSRQIDDVMNYARDVPLVATTESVQEILRRSLDLVPVPDHISTSLPENDVQVTCDPEKMEIVFANLLLNAVQSIGDSRGRITVRIVEGAEGNNNNNNNNNNNSSSSSSSSSSNNNNNNGAYVALEFENSGPAIPEKDLQVIFEPLFTTKINGTGLGLASCRSVVGRHGGSITASNDPVRFTLRMPRDAAVAADTRREGGR